jgi:hypothetical protein
MTRRGLHRYGALERNTFQRSSRMTTRASNVRDCCSFGTSYVPAKLTLRLILAMNTRNSRDARVPICCRDQHAPSSSYPLAMILIREWSPYSDICPCRVLQPTPIHLPVASVCLKFEVSGHFETAFELPRNVHLVHDLQICPPPRLRNKACC